jgi:signal transduction histidine kinase/CheY-like chemotaxis protein
MVLTAIIFGLMKKINLTKQTIKLNQQELQKITQLQQQSDSAKSDAIAANLAKNRYLSGISHELRTPLNVIMGYAQLLESQTTSEDVHHKKYTLIRHNCEHLAHLIEGILEFSAIEAGKLKVKLEIVNLHDLIKQIIMMFNNQAEHKGLKFISQIDPNLPKKVKTDHQRLQQIIINLLSNAIKFTDQGQIEFIISYKNQVATIKIKDSGCGIDTKDLTKIFEPFERIESHNKPVSGTGLGLPITKLLVDLLGGELTVSSNINQGSQFTVKMMLASLHHQDEVLVEHKIATNSPDSSKNNHIQLLVVDDEPSQRSLILDLLQPQGFHVTGATDAFHAQQLLQQHTFSMIIIDVAMPGMDGWELAAWVHTQFPDVKIMMLSANPRDAETSSNLHHDVYLTKPVNLKLLLSNINQLLSLDAFDSQLIEPLVSQPENIKLSQKDTVALLNMIDIGHINGIEIYLANLLNDHLISAQQHQQLSWPIKQMNLNSFKTMVEHAHQ